MKNKYHFLRAVKRPLVEGMIGALILGNICLLEHASLKYKNKLNQKKLEEVVLKESENFLTKKTYNDHKCIMRNKQNNKLVLVYTKDKGEPFDFLEQSKIADDSSMSWEKTINKAKKIDAQLKNQLKQELQSQWGVRPRAFFGYMNEEKEKDLIKWIYEASEKSDQNKYGIKIDPSELFTTYMLEGGIGFMEERYKISHYAGIDGFKYLGLDHIGDPREIKRLKNAGFIPPDLKIMDWFHTNEKGKEVMSGWFYNLQDGLAALSGVLAQRKYTFSNDFKTYFGKEEFQKLTDDEIFFWTSLYYNCGEGYGKNRLSKREKIYGPLIGGEIQNTNSAKQNALIRLTTNKWIKELDLFSSSPPIFYMSSCQYCAKDFYFTLKKNAL